MRLALWLALIPCVAHAHGVLIVPENDAARTVMESLVEQLGRPGLTLKTAGGRSPAIACLKDKNAHNRNQCLVAAAASANVSGLLLVSSSTARRVVTAQFEVVSEETGKPVFAETLKAPEVITNRSPDQMNAQQWLSATRQYWGIEGGLHQRLDASTNEDNCRVRNRNGVWVLGMMRRLAVSLFAEWRSRDEKRKRKTMPDFQAEMSAEHIAPAIRFVTARYPAFRKRS